MTWAIAAYSLLGGVVAAQVVQTDLPPMSTDRPDFTESATVVGKGVVQAESGFTIEQNPDSSNLAGPEILMRIGIARRWELRIGGDGFLSQRMVGSDRVLGYSDADLGVKVRLFDQGPRTPAVSLVPKLSLPVGSALFSSGGYDSTLKVALDKDLPKHFSLSGNLNFSALTEPGGRFLQTGWSASVGHGLPKGFGGFWEIFGFAPWEKDGSPAWIADAGVTRFLGRNAQIDVRAGRRLTNSGPGWFWGLGFAFRQPKLSFFR